VATAAGKVRASQESDTPPINNPKAFSDFAVVALAKNFNQQLSADVFENPVRIAVVKKAFDSNKSNF
jgi:hypothetical protein